MSDKIYRILLVDDDTDVLSVSERILQRLGYNVIAHSSSNEALDLFKDLPGQFDLVITDFCMPDMDGAELSREILRIKPDMPIIICSGFASDFSEKDAKDMGIKWFVRKPLLKKDFATLVKSVLKTCHILLVDDDVEVLALYQKILEGIGCRVVSHSRGGEALDFFKAQPGQFDLVITDFRMPGMNGAELSRKILQVKPGMPIIMCTGCAGDFSEEDAKAVGIKWFAEKPLGKKDLVNLFENAFKTCMENSAI